MSQHLLMLIGMSQLGKSASRSKALPAQKNSKQPLFLRILIGHIPGLAVEQISYQG